MKKLDFTRQDVAMGLSVFTAFCFVGNLEQADGAQAVQIPQQEQTQILAPLEDPNESAFIETALLEQGYFRDDVPLSYELQDHLHAACSSADISYFVGLGLIDVESRFQKDAVSPCGSYGLCQLNPVYFPADLPPAENIAAGIDHLGQCLERYHGNLEAALTAYNAGSDTGERSYASAVLNAAQHWETPKGMEE